MRVVVEAVDSNCLNSALIAASLAWEDEFDCLDMREVAVE